VLEHHRVAGHERGSGGPEDLPVGEVPRHDREDSPERIEGDPALGRIGWRGLIGEEFVGVLREVLAAARALGDLRTCLCDRLPHLAHGMAREAVLVVTEEVSDAVDHGTSLGDRFAAPLLEGGVRAHERLLDARRGVELELLEGLFGRGITGLDGVAHVQLRSCAFHARTDPRGGDGPRAAGQGP
jgi:hypothetical protein